jgi:serine/threonine protein kinase
MSNKSFKVRVRKNTVEITDKDYKASGGQAVVYCIGDTAYKIYHDPARMIPEAKIQELSVLGKMDTILGPREVVYDFKTNQPLGFTMPYVDGTEFLCKIFTRNFRDDNNIDPQDITHLVTEMQKALEYIHSHKILVVDYNEMNFLLDSKFKKVYHIDVDSWQTKFFPAQALMESVRDRKGIKGKFTELTDWFSFGVVTFQMYVGIHPFKGFHPKFGPAEWCKRMDLGISVFDKDVQLPAACQDFSIIPPKHLAWYKELFVKGDRSIPPYADSVLIGTGMGRVVSSKGKFIVELLAEYKTPVKKLYFFDNKRYVIAEDGIYHGDIKIAKGSKTTRMALCDVYAEDPLPVVFSKGFVSFISLSGGLIESVPSEHAMSANGLIYTVNGGDLIEHSFERLGKLLHMTKVVSSLCPSYKVFSGVIVQDDFMKCHLVIPFGKNLCANIHVKELDGYRIIDAKAHGHVCILFAEKGGEYFKNVLFFDKTFSKYTIWVEKTDLHGINFVSLPNGLYVLADHNDRAIVFSDINHRQEFLNSPINASTRLFNEGMTVLSIDGNKIYKVRMS